MRHRQGKRSTYSSRRVCAVLGVVVGLAVGALGGDITIARPQRAGAAPAPVEALLIGDSVLNGLGQGYSAAGRAALAARHSFILDAAGCRRLITTSCRIPPGPTPTNAITVLRARTGQYDRALVIAAGYDDPSSGPTGIAAAVAEMVGEARRQGIEHVIWLTYREAGSGSDAARFRASNAVLRGLRGTYPDLTLADWAGRSAGLPTGWFSADGIHLGPQSSAAMADLIGDALDGLPPKITRCSPQQWTGVPPSSAAGSTGASAAGGLHLLVSPVRIVDTRPDAGKLGGGRVLTVPVAGVAGVPDDAVAAVVSVTAVEPCSDTFLTVFPCGEGVPTASTVNAVAGSIVANSIVARLGGGALCVITLHPSDVIVDVTGWVGPGGMGTEPVAPLRLTDTRPGQPQALATPQTRLGARQALTVDLGSLPGVDASVTAATINVTVANPSGPGFVAVLPGPCAAATLPPTTSNLDFVAHRDAAATATIGLVNGDLCVYSMTETDIVIDLQALHGPAPHAADGNGTATTAIDPLRILDTRATTRLHAGDTIALDTSTVADAALVNLTAVLPSASGFVTLSPCGKAVPNVSNVNFVVGDVVANRAVVSTDGTSRFCLFSSADTDVVIDLTGFVGSG